MRWPLFGWSPREVRAIEIELSTAQTDDRMSFFVVGSLGARESWCGRPLLGSRPHLLAAGFAARWSDTLAGQPHRLGTLDVHTLDRFMSFGPGAPTRRLAEVRVREAPAYDLLYRSDIGATGVSIQIEVHPGVVGPVVDFLEAEVGLHHPWTEHQSGFLFRFPVTRRFAFPEPRGLGNPYGGGPAGLGRMRSIATFRADSLDVAIVGHPRAPAFDWATQPLSALVGAPRILSLSW